MKPPIDPISQDLYLALMAIPPSGDDNLEYRPASLQLKDGTLVDRAYVMAMPTYLSWWGPDWEGRSYLPIRDVSESQNARLGFHGSLQTNFMWLANPGWVTAYSLLISLMGHPAFLLRETLWIFWITLPANPAKTSWM
jgi:hypothetical protein